MIVSSADDNIIASVLISLIFLHIIKLKSILLEKDKYSNELNALKELFQINDYQLSSDMHKKPKYPINCVFRQTCIVFNAYIL